MMNNNLNYFTFLNNHLSIQKFLSICLILLISFSIFILGIFNYYQMKQQNEELFEVHMVNSAHAIDALLSAALKDTSQRQLSNLLHSILTGPLNNITNNLRPEVIQFNNIYKDSFAFQVYDRRSGKMLLHSAGSPRQSIYSNCKLDKFQNITLKHGKIDKVWKVFTENSQYQPYRIIVLVSSDFQHQMFLNLFRSALWDLIFIYIFFIHFESLK